MSKDQKLTPLTEEQKKLVEDNLAYAVWYAGKICKKDDRLDFYDLREVTYYALVEAAVKYDPNKSEKVGFFGFLRFLTKYAVIDFMRKESNARKILPRVSIEECAAVPSKDYGNLWEAINSLKDEHREMLLDYYLNGLSQPEIAAKNNISTAAVCTQLQRILEKIKSELC